MPISPKSRRIIITASVLTLLIAGLGLAVVPVMLERWLNQYDLQSAFSNATGGGTISAGPVELRLLPAPHLVVPAGALNLPGATSGSWSKIRIHPSFKSVIAGRIRIRSIKIVDPDFRIEKLLNSGPHKPAEADVGQLTPDQLRIMLLEALGRMDTGLKWLAEHAPEAAMDVRGGRLQLPDASGQQMFQLDDIEARLQIPPETFQLELDCKSPLFRDLRIAGTVESGALSGQLDLWFNKLDTQQLASLAGWRGPLKQFDGMLSGHVSLNLAGRSHIEGHLSLALPELILQRLANPLMVRNFLMDGKVLIDASKIHLELDRVYADQPLLNLTGHIRAGGPGEGLRIQLVGSDIRISEARQATLALAGDHNTVAGIFNVLRDGQVPWITWRTEGPDIAALGAFANMKLTGEVEAGQLYIPGADLHLTEVNGVADIADEVLRGEALSARSEATLGQEGELWLDFGRDGMPFFLEIDTQLTDVGVLPPRLVQWVNDAAFRSELKKLDGVQGEARGKMILDSRKGQGIEVTVDVTRCRLEARYARLPWAVQIEQGQVQYTGDRIAVDHMQGRIGTNRISGLKAHIDFDREPRMHIESARLTLDLKAVVPWLASMAVFEAMADQYRVTGNIAEISGLTLRGPVFSPSQWDFDLRGRFDRLEIASDNLPAALNFRQLQLKADQDAVAAESREIKMLDAEVAGQGRAVFQTGRLRSYALTFNGTLGEKADKWINDLFEEDDDVFRMRTPLEISTASINWSDGEPVTTAAEFVTSQGVQVSMESEWQPQTKRKEHFQISDGDNRATITFQNQPDQVAIGFKGVLASQTLDRLFLNNPFASGRLKGDLQAVIVPRQPGQSTANGRLTAENIRLPLDIDRKILISRLQLVAADNRLQIAPAAFLIDDSWHTIEGEVQLSATQYKVDLKHEGAFLELPAGGEDQGQEESSTLQRWLQLPIAGELRSRLSVLKRGDYRWVPLKTTTTLLPGQWRIDIEEAGLCGIQTAGSVVLHPQKSVIDLRHTASRAALNTSLSCLLGKRDLVDGHFNLDGRLTEEAPMDQLGQALDGHFKFKAEDGRIYRFDLLGRILAAINLTELVRGRKSDLMGEGLAYREIEIEAQLKENRLTFEKALIDGASAEIAANGSIDLDADEIDMVVLVAPLKTVDAIVKFTPIVNTWLEGTLISIPVKVSGDLQDPRITPLSPTAVGSSLLNLLKNTVKLPIKLVEPLFDSDDEDEKPQDP